MIEKVKLVWSKTNRWHRGLLLFLVIELRLLPAGQLGFTCKDPALSYPYTGDTISWKLLLLTNIVLPLIVMLIVERKYHSDKIVKSKEQALCWYKEYLFGLLINLTIVQLLKTIVGSPRPHFFDTCDPKEAKTCQGDNGSLDDKRLLKSMDICKPIDTIVLPWRPPSQRSEYVPSYTCSKAHWLSQSDRSFPSGHTSLAVHTGIFLAYYLYRRTSSPRSKGIISLQLACVATAVLCSVSRMTDHRHHWWDVLAGAAIAAPILLYTIDSLCGNFKCSQNQTAVTTEESVDCEQSIDYAPVLSAKET